MDEKHISALKKIALLGGVDDYAVMSSGELGSELRISQQSASKRILKLLDSRLIIRDLGARKQRIKLTDKGIEAIKKEYTEYQKIFESEGYITLRGVVTSGMGEGKYYVCQKDYMDQFKKILGYIPYEGTFNVAIDKDELGKLDLIRNTEGMVIKGFSSTSRSFGDVALYKAKIHNVDCAVIVPKRSHYKEILEIVCQFHIRRTFGLSEGDSVDLRVEL
ncbi:MAG: DUF120 domain-containing protein [archaeon]|nr:DUF120 domain-containing protein [archaeon]